MTKDIRKAIDSAHKGNPIECSAEDYNAKIRAAIILFALDCVDCGDEVRMQIALSEVDRLDKMHGYGLSVESPDERA
jgi:hypothetical protein